MEPPFRPGRPGASARREHVRRRARSRERAKDRLGPLAVLAGEPSHVKAWQRGAAGEEHTARELERRLAGSDVVFLHDRSLPGRRANVDHIAIGPRGVTVIESKHVRGEVRAAGGGWLSGPPRLLVDKRDRTAWIEAVLDQGRAVWSVLAAAGFADLPLYGCICLPDPSGLPPLGTIEIDGVRVLGPRRLAKRLAADGPLSVIQIDSAAAALARGLPSR